MNLRPDPTGPFLWTTMPYFSDTSQQRLDTCDVALRQLFAEVIKKYDCTILCGHRPEDEQTAAYEAGRSKVQWPNSKHNSLPSRAVDVAPYPIEWPNKNMKQAEYTKAMGRFYMFVGYVRAKADEMHINIRCGADWDGDMELKDQNFDDLPHFELV